MSTLKIDHKSNLWGAEGNISETWKKNFEVNSTFSAVEDIEIFNRLQATISASSLAPLFILDNLKSFVINDSIVLSGSDDDFRLLAGGFHNLKRFVISRPLYYLSRECPDLREITITLSSNISDNLNAIKMLPHPIVRNHLHLLEKFYIDSDFGQLQLIQLVQVARFLDPIFPDLSTLETDKSKLTRLQTGQSSMSFVQMPGLIHHRSAISASELISGEQQNISLKDCSKLHDNCKILCTNCDSVSTCTT